MAQSRDVQQNCPQSDLPLRAGVVLLYLGAALLSVRLASETTILYYERHLIWGAKFDR